MQEPDNNRDNNKAGRLTCAHKAILSVSLWLILLASGIFAVSQAHAEAVASISTPSQTNDTFNRIITKAKTLAEQAYVDSSSALPQALQDISYQQYRSIRFNSQKSMWRGQSDYELQFFHPGFLYRKPVQLIEVKSEKNSLNNPIPFEPSWFNYEGEAATLSALSSNNHGYAGFRIHYPLNTSEYKDEVAVFLGASYFRIIGAGQNYGISARGLAINTADASGEEFPYFKKFWLEQPKPNQPMTFYALLDSPSVSGAYRFVLQPGQDTSVTVSAHIFARKTVKKLGIAALTSMFLYGENSKHTYDDFRPEVHDSDGLLMQTQLGEWIWRPLTNSKQLLVTSLSDNNPQGFGLLQRDTDFDHYLDAEAHYHNRPGLWVSPIGEWGAGRIELVEIPTDSETNDNIVSYWVSETPLLEGEHTEFDYRLSTVNGNLASQNVSKVLRTRQGAVVLPGMKMEEKNVQRRFVIDFDASGLGDYSASHLPEVDLQVTNGSAREIEILPVLNGKLWRVTFLLTANAKAVDMRLFIKNDTTRLSEVWNYVWKNNATN